MLCGKHSRHRVIKSSIHPDVPVADLGAIGMTMDEIQRFSATTIQDAKSHFNHCHWSSDELFCAYIKQSDEIVPYWLDIGIQTFKLTSTI